MDRPLEVIDKQNVTLKSTDTEKVQPLLVVQFPCAVHGNCLELECSDYTQNNTMPISVCCSAVHFRNVSQAHIDGIEISSNSTNVSALVIEHCIDIRISSVILTNGNLIPMTEFGLLVYESSKIVVDILQASKFLLGIAACKSHFISISNTNINNMWSGVYIVDSDHASVVNVMSQSNRYHGILSVLTNHTTITNSTFQNNGDSGITLIEATFSDISHSLSDNNYIGFILGRCTDTFVHGMHVTHNIWNGFDIESCTNLTMINIVAEHTQYRTGVYISNATGVMKSVYSSNNRGVEIVVIDAAAMHMENISADYNAIGIELYYSNISMAFVSANHNENIGILIFGSRDTIIMNSSSMRNNGNGVQIEKDNNIRIIDSHMIHNKGGDIRLIYSINITIVRTVANVRVHKSNHIYVKEIGFFGMSSSSTISSTIEPTSLPAIVELYNSNVTVCNCSFTKNTVSAIKAIGSEVTFFGELTFSHNRALTGTALLFARSSLSLAENCKAFFFENYASNVGGVIYINTEESYVSSITLRDIYNLNYIRSLTTSMTKCFTRVEGSRSDTRLVFINNTAEKGGDVLYGGLVALGWDGDWNCLLSFKNISDMSQQSGLSTITSNPSRVCFCKDAKPDCLTVTDPITHHIYPGQTVTIPAVVMGQDFGTVTGSVYAKFLNTSFDVEMEPGQNVSNIDQSQCSSIEYTIFSKNTVPEAVLVLTADRVDVSYTLDESNNQEMLNSWTILNKEPNYRILALTSIHKFLDNSLVFTPAYYDASLQPNKRPIKDFYKFTLSNPRVYFLCPECFTTKLIFPKIIYNLPIYISVSFLPCPAGFTLTSEKPYKCDCNHQLQHLPTVKCHIQDQTISRSGLVWVGSDGNETVITSQQCPLEYCKQEDINVTLDNPDSQCIYNHSGTLCGGCQAGLSLVLGSNRCQHCSNAYIALLLPFAISGIFLVFFIKGIDLTISQGTLNCFIFYANVIKVNAHWLFPQKQTPFTVFISWLNLDLGIETCFYDGLSAYTKVWLQFIFPLYIWSIAGLIIVLSRYSDRVAKVMGNNSVPVLATLFLLSYAKLLRTIISALSFSMLTGTESSKAVWSADGHLDYFGVKHAPLFIAAVASLLILWLPYTLVLFLGQWLYRCKSQLITRMLIKIKPFLDAHYGPMKSNHRYWYGALLLLRVTIFLLSVLIPANHTSIVVFCITVCSFLLTYFTLIVYQSLVIAMFAAILYANLGILTASHLFTVLEDYNSFLSSNLLVGLAFTQFIGLVLFKIAVVFNVRETMRQWICNQGLREDNGDDDWELYEEAALLREREAQLEQEADLGGVVDEQSENKSTNSTVSLPTYGV